MKRTAPHTSKNGDLIAPSALGTDTAFVPTAVGPLTTRVLILLVEDGPGSGQNFQLKQGTSIIGRSANADIRLDHPSISRQHVQLDNRSNRYFVRDLGSQNGTFVNRSVIQGEIEVGLGDELAIGNAVLRLVEPIYPKPVQDRPPVAYEPTEQWSVQASTISLETRPSANMELGAGNSPVSTVTSKTRRGPSLGQAAIATGVLGVCVAFAVAFVLTKGKDKSARGLETESREAKIEIVSEIIVPEPVAEDTSNKETQRSEANNLANELRFLQERFSRGLLTEAIELANKPAHSEIFEKLTLFKQAYERAKQDARDRNYTEAIRGYEEALATEREISGGDGEFNREIRQELSDLLVSQARLQQDNNNLGSAQKSAELALKYNPQNSSAKAILTSVQGGKSFAGSAKSSPKRKPSVRRSGFDEDPDFANERKPGPKKKSSKIRSAIDDAFDE